MSPAFHEDGRRPEGYREIRFAGFGGQGIILAGLIAGKAASLFDGRNAVLTESYGPEARGGACSAGVIISDEKIFYPHVSAPDTMMIMSQEAFKTYGPAITADGLMVVDADLVTVSELKKGVRLYKVPFTALSEEVGKRIVANIVMLGAFTAVSGAVSLEAMKKSVLATVPKGTEELNMKAFQKGFDAAKALL
ncbi:MAG: pyruvate ferredoxin oxidoreductase [Euryarchaeota archaeon]|nr:pyruvate ferredoxin oxidoreductase [Euryarchaeota archaeon]